MRATKTILAGLLLAGLQAQAGFVENQHLPPMFRQLEIARPDGSSATVFVSNFNDSFEARRPLLVYIEGSGAMSQFIRAGKMTGYGMYGLLAERASDRFHVATVEKRGVPFGWQVEQTGSAIGASEEYQRFATLDERVADVRLAITALLSQPTVDPSKVLLIGHSEGADIAAVVAGRDDRVTHVACLAGGGAPQFFDAFVSRRKQLGAAGASSEEIAASMSRLEEQVRTILADPDRIDEFWRGHPYRRWASFAAHAAADELVKTSARVFVAHGNEDQAVPMESFDYLVVRLLAGGNPDVTIRRYPGRDHGFGGKDIEAGDGLSEVIEDAIEWSNR